MQDFRSLPEYLVATQWKVLTNPAVNAEKRVEVVLEHALRLSCRTPSEGSFQVMTALVLASAEGLEVALSLAPSGKHQTLLLVKAAWRRLARRVGLDGAGLQALPERPALLEASSPELYRQVFGDGEGPAPSPFEPAAWLAMVASVPLRNTNKRLASAHASAMPAVTPALMTQCFQMFSMMCGARRPNGIDLTFFPKAPARSPPLIAPATTSATLTNGCDIPSSQASEMPASPGPLQLQLPTPALAPFEAVDSAELALVTPPSRKARLSVEEATNLIQNEILARDNARHRIGQKTATAPVAKAASKASPRSGAKGLVPKPKKSPPKTKQAAKDPELTKAKPRKKLPAITVERTRDQVVLRSVDGRCRCMKFAGNEDAVMAEARAWLAKERRRA